MSLKMPNGESLKSRLDRPLDRETMAEEINRTIGEMGKALRSGDATESARRYHHLRVMWELYRTLTDGHRAT